MENALDQAGSELEHLHELRFQADAARRAADEARINAEVRLASREQLLAEIFGSRGWAALEHLRRGKQRFELVAAKATSPLRWGLRRHASPVATTSDSRAPKYPDAGAQELVDIPLPWEYVVTVVIPVFNKGRALHAGVASVRDQTLDGIEVVIWDDGSTDPETRAAIQEIEGSNLPDVAIFRGPNRGVSAARNAGIAVGRGYFVCCLDADDILEPTYIEKAVALLSGSPETALAYPWVKVRGDRQEVWRTNDLDAHTIPSANHVPTCALLRREVIWATGGFRTDMRDGYEDWEHWAHAASLGFRGRVIREQLFEHRRSDDVSPFLEARARLNKNRISGESRRIHGGLDGSTRRSVATHPVLEPAWWATKPRHYPRGDAQPIIVAVPWFTLGGADLILEELIRHWRKSRRTVIAVMTEVLGPGMANRADDLLEITPYIYSLPDLLPQEYWLPFTVGIGRSLVDPILVIHGSRWAYESIETLRASVPRLQVIDKQFNDVGHFELACLSRDSIDMTVACNEALRRTFVERGWDTQRTTTIYDNVSFDARRLDQDDRMRARDRLGVPRDAHVLLFVGRLSDEKRPIWAVELAKHLAAEDAWLVLVGDGPLQVSLREAMIDTQNVRWLPSVERARMPELYGAADLLVLPSLAEGVPLTLLEATSVGIPVVATSVGGLVEFDRHAGIHLVDPNDFDQFVATVRSSLADPVEPDPPGSQSAVEAMTAAWDRVFEILTPGL